MLDARGPAKNVVSSGVVYAGCVEKMKPIML